MPTERRRTPAELNEAMLRRLRGEAAVQSGGITVSRKHKLKEIFQAFDLDGNGSVGSQELLKLGKARRTMKQKGGEWTEKQNQAMMKRLDKDGNGKVGEAEFVAFFDDSLPPSQPDFDEIMDQFMSVANSVNQVGISPTRSPPKDPEAQKGLLRRAKAYPRDSSPLPQHLNELQGSLHQVNHWQTPT